MPTSKFSNAKVIGRAYPSFSGAVGLDSVDAICRAGLAGCQREPYLAYIDCPHAAAQHLVSKSVPQRRRVRRGPVARVRQRGDFFAFEPPSHLGVIDEEGI